MRILEVGPRDGLQNEKTILTIDQRELLIQNLLASGLSDIEIGSFVKAESIPQLANTYELAKKIIPYKKKKFPQKNLWAFVPNEKGLERAIETQIDGVSFFCATSETFTQKNINRNFKELKTLLISLKQLLPKKFPNRVYLSTLVYCPFEGIIKPTQVFKWIDFLLNLGFEEIALSDTTGHAHPQNLTPIFKKITHSYNLKNFALHFHDTRGTALLNTYVALKEGFQKFDSSLGGLGGCPYAPGATGNLATEDLLYLLQSQGKFKNISLKKLTHTSFLLEKYLGKTLPCRILQTIRCSQMQSQIKKD
jgi:hydroxymethylglutaryl-CoA lyase